MPTTNTGESLEFFPTAYLAMDSSDFMLVTDWNKTLSNGAELVKTQRGGVVGVSRGKSGVQITFNAPQGENGPEHDWEKLVDKATRKTLRVKRAGGRVSTYAGVFTNHVEASPLEGTPTDALTFIGKRVK